MSKSQRQFRIAQLLSSSTVGTAAQLVALLHEDGITATQATIARDLQELGAVKVRNQAGGRHLSIPAATPAAPAPLDHLRRMMGEWAVSVESSHTLVVVRTPPGCAHVVASALDRSALDGVIGTVAGDDTILVIASEVKGGIALADDLRSLAGIAAGTKGRNK